MQFIFYIGRVNNISILFINMAKSRTNRRFRNKSKKSLRKSSRTRKYKGGMRITGVAFLGLLASCAYLVDSSFYKFAKGFAATNAAIKANKAVRDRDQRGSAAAAAAKPPAAAKTSDGGIVIAFSEQLKLLSSPSGQPTFAPELDDLVAVKCNKDEYDILTDMLQPESEAQLSNEDESKLPKILDNLTKIE
jgi:hypothetical protein